MLMAAETFAVNTSRVGSVPRNSAVRQRAPQSSGGTWPHEKIGRPRRQPLAQLRDALEHRLRRRPERASVQHAHGGIEVNLLASRPPIDVVHANDSN